MGSAILKEKKYKQFEADMQFVPVGPKGGVGVVFGSKVPSFFVWLAKSRSFLLEKAPRTGEGAGIGFRRGLFEGLITGKCFKVKTSTAAVKKVVREEYLQSFYFSADI